MKEALIVWLLALMNSVSPAHRPHFEAAAQETFDQADTRYEEIADAIVDVAYDPAEKPLFRGTFARAQTAFFVLFKFGLESGYRRDIHLGLDRKRLAQIGWNDSGRSWCMGQVMLGRKSLADGTEDSATKTTEGWTGKDLVGDVHKCARASLHILHRSFGACSSLPREERLAGYIAGNCTSETARAISRQRMGGFDSLWGRLRPKFPNHKDVDVMVALMPVPDQFVTAPVLPPIAPVSLAKQ